MMNLALSGLTLTNTKKKDKKMKITEFNKMVCEKEGGQKELTIAQIAEVIKIADESTNGIFYKIIDLMATRQKDV